MVELLHGESEASRRILQGLAVAFLLSTIVLGLEALGAFLSRSLALTVDAAHAVPDLVAFGVSYFSLTWIARGSTGQHTFGSHRLEVFAATLNAFVILAAGVLFAYPSILELVGHTPLFGPIEPVWILSAALPTMVLRVVSALYLGRIPRVARDLNVRSVLVHLGADIAITAALIVDAILLFFSHSNVQVDALVALVIASILVYESIPIFQGAWDVLTERVPRGVSLTAVNEAIRSISRVKEVHDLHVWAVCPTFVCLTAHVRVEEMNIGDCGAVTDNLREIVERKFGIAHSVFELESESSAHFTRREPQ